MPIACVDLLQKSANVQGDRRHFKLEKNLRDRRYWMLESFSLFFVCHDVPFEM